MNKNNLVPVSIILLVHNEAKIIGTVIKDFYEKVISKIPDSQFIVCEDGSIDGTKEILSSMQNNYNLDLHMCDSRKGYTKAMKDAYSIVNNPIILFSDSDGQHEPDDFWKLYSLINKYDMVIGWKKNRKDSMTRLIITKIFNKIINYKFEVKFHDIDCGFRLIKKEVVDFLLIHEWRLKHCINAELTIRAVNAGYKVTEIPVHHYQRKFGESRGLPMKKLFRITIEILQGLKKIKRDIHAT